MITLDREIAIGTIIIVLALIGLLHPIIVLVTYKPMKTTLDQVSLVKAIYESMIKPRIIFTGKQDTITIPNNTSVLVLKARSSIIELKDACNGSIVLKDLANIPSEYIVHEANNTLTITIIGYYAEISIPCNLAVLKIDSRIAYLDLKILEHIPNILDVYLLGSIAKADSIINKQIITTITLEDSLLEYSATYLKYIGENSIEVKATSSIAYLNVSIPKNTRLRIIKTNIGGVIEVLINGSKVLEPYHIDEAYYESKTRLHIGVTSIGGGVRVDVIRRSR